jgi:dihydropteroate synthase
MSESNYSLNLGGELINLKKPIIMGILNITPDSFYDGGRYVEVNSVLRQTERLLNEGASIIDIGAASSRPNAIEISQDEEISRLIPMIDLLVKRFKDIKISVDTYRSNVAKLAVEAGAVMINDISGGELDKNMFEMVADLKVPYVLMHMKGNPQTMMQLAHYEDIVLEIMAYFHSKVVRLRALGVNDIILDLGFGFSKNIDQNFHLLKKMAYFKKMNLPILAGVSRKSMIYKTLGIEVSEALNGTTVLNTMALVNGANILRVHDVKQAKETIELYSKVYLD